MNSWISHFVYGYIELLHHVFLHVKIAAFDFNLVWCLHVFMEKIMLLFQMFFIAFFILQFVLLK
jgi:hypothetical protein